MKISELNDSQRDEIDFIESIVNINDKNKEKTKEKVIDFMKRHVLGNSKGFFLKSMDHAAKIRPKEREHLIYLLISVFEEFKINYHKLFFNSEIDEMLKIKGYLPLMYRNYEHIFDFAEEETIERFIFDDDVDKLQQKLAVFGENEETKMIDLGYFFPSFCYCERFEGSKIETSALFGSVKCFKYLMMNEIEMDEPICIFAIAGGNFEIVHLCEQKGFKFENCLDVSAFYHRYELFEWLNIHFEFTPIYLTKCLNYLNEPLFYFFISKETNVNIKCSDGFIPINAASNSGCLEIVKYLYEKHNADIEIRDYMNNTPINIAAGENNLEIIQYLYDTCHANIETRNDDESTPINTASSEGYLDIVKYLYEDCHSNIHTKDSTGCIPINSSAKFGKSDIVKYLFEHCHENIDVEDKYGNTPINNASRMGNFETVKYLYEECHANIETKDCDGNTPIIYASILGDLEAVKYLYETCHANVNANDDSINTPLYQASRNGHLEVVKYLCEVCYADTEISDDDYRIPLYKARDFEDKEVVKYLESFELKRLAQIST